MAAQLVYALCALKGMAAGGEAQRAWASLRKLQAETTESRTLEMRVLSLSPCRRAAELESQNNKAVLQRMAELGEVLTTSSDGGTDYKAELGLFVVEAMKSWALEGLADYSLVTREKVVESHGYWKQCVQHIRNATAAAPDEPQGSPSCSTRPSSRASIRARSRRIRLGRLLRPRRRVARRCDG